MITKIIPIIILFALPKLVSGQCADFKFLNFGTTKFDAINFLNSSKSFKALNVQDEYYEHYDYLAGDSVLISVIRCVWINHPCFNKDVSIFLKFENRKFYYIEYNTLFDPNDFARCKVEYDKINNTLWDFYANENDAFDYRSSFETFSVGDNSKEEEKIGEGFSMFKSEAESKNLKRYKLSIDYRLNYEKKYDNLQRKSVPTGKIESYNIRIIHYDLTITKKIDIRGY